jgi:catechol 2,3-dioxygenase-like lactoylglutathione lyase family enzyme
MMSRERMSQEQKTEQKRMIAQLDHVNIIVSDLDKAIQFFSLLGFVERTAGELSGDWISKIVGLDGVKGRYVAIGLPESHTNIELMQYYSPQGSIDPNISKANQIGFRHLAFEVQDIESVVARLEENGVEFLSEIQLYPATGKKLVYFYGPDGVLLELAQYGQVPRP